MSDVAGPIVQEFYPDDFAHCYGCGRHNAHGLHVATHWNGTEARATFRPAAHQIAVPGFVYGGLIASLLDCHAMATAAAAAEQAAGRAVGEVPAPRYVTASLRVDFLAPTPIGVDLELRARVKERSERKAIVEATLAAAGTITARGEIVAVRMPESMRDRSG